MGDELKQCLDKDRFDRFDKDCCRHEEFVTSCDHSDDWGLADWLPIIIIVFLLCGGTNIFGGGYKDDGCDNSGFGGSWLLILLVIFLFLGNQRDGKGFMGGLF